MSFWQKLKRPPWRTLAALAVLALVALTAYALWSPGEDFRDGRHDRGANGIWLSHGWLGDDGWFERYGKEARKPDFRSPKRISELAARLRAHNVTDVFPHLCPADPGGKIPPVDREQAERFLDELIGFGVMPWVGGVRGSSAFPEDAKWRAGFAESVRGLLAAHPRLAGVQVNIEPCPSGDGDFLKLLDELRAALPAGKLLSVAAYPPPTRWHPHPDVHWEESYYREVAERADQLAVMMYDTALRWEKPYRKLTADWTRQALAWSGGTEVLLGLPTYDDAGVGYHHPAVENLENALLGVHAGLASFGKLPASYQGTAIYCGWQTDAAEWRLYRERFVSPGKVIYPVRGAPPGKPAPKPAPIAKRPRACRVVHVFVPLCDNRNQGIVKVVASLGDGQNPGTNLYWGARFGVRTFFSRSEHWKRLGGVAKSNNAAVLERLVFRGRSGGRAVYLVAEAYDGARMRAALENFLAAAAGRGSVEVVAGEKKLAAGGAADMVAFCGHNGLMDLKLDSVPKRAGKAGPDCAAVLACKSRDYFLEPLKSAGCRPLVTTTGFMAPEAYTLDAIIRSWAAGEPPALTRKKAAAAYAKYQRCSQRAAEKLFAAGSGR